MSAGAWTPAHPLIGRVLERRFQITAYIREGGMAQVFCGAQSAEPRHVAIKIMHPELTEDPELVARFVREARIAARLHHPNIVQIVHVGEDRELTYMAMELLFGDDLSARVKTKGSFTEARALEIIIDVCNALQHAHDLGIVHRDIKPENVMLCRQPSAPTVESVRVLDFGIAKILDAAPGVALPEEAPTGVRSVLTRVGTWVGTPAYMSPEQGRAEVLDHRSDIYSTGVLLYELLCGRPPFEGETPLQIIARHVQEEPIPPSKLAPVHPEVERIVLRALAKHPDERWGSARELAQALTYVLPDLTMESSQRWSAPTLTGKVAKPALREEVRAPRRRDPRRESMTGQVPDFLAASPRASDAKATLPSAGRGAQASPSAELPPSASHSALRALQRTVTIDLEEERRLAASAPAKPDLDTRSIASRTHPLLGHVLAGRYQVASFVREGSMAQIFCGYSEQAPRHVAIKVVHPELAHDRDVVARFLREAQIAARLSHPNIVRVLHAGQEEGLLYMIMELLYGDDLSARIKQRGAFSQERAVQIAIEVCRALAHAHAQGVVHRDIKPENVMLCRQVEAPDREVVKVLDFGIAKILDEQRDAALPTESPTAVRSVLTRVGALVGTPAYMSPEQGRAEPVDHRSDVYSVGVLLFELVCGRPPFEGQTPMQIVMRHVREAPPRPSTLARVSPELEAVMLRALEKDPAQRFQSAEDFAQALERAASPTDLAAQADAAIERWRRRLDRTAPTAEAMSAVAHMATASVRPPSGEVRPSVAPGAGAAPRTSASIPPPSAAPAAASAQAVQAAHPPAQAAHSPATAARSLEPSHYDAAATNKLARPPVVAEAARAPASPPPTAPSKSDDARIARLMKLVTVLLLVLALVLVAFVVVLVVVFKRG